ncbi:MAG: pyridoxamine 5'-phosphate oxidase family protein [Yaniella sp.]|nr:pyridoxamine 5'-phosphate oxidase family protein [Yaniella sp.]
MTHEAQGDILNRIWQALHDATSQGTGFTLGFLATIGVGGGPRARAVILRQFEAAPARIYFATNVHSDKGNEIQQHPQVALTLQDGSVQLRIQGKAGITDDAERIAAWEALAPHSRQLYATAGLPGEAMDETAELADDPCTAFQRFAWVRIDLEHLDWLDLAADAPQRWEFDLEVDGWVGKRVVP